MSFLILFSLLSTKAHALSDQKLAELCLEVGNKKIQAVAKNWNCSFDRKNIVVQEIYNSDLTTSSFVWYRVKAKCEGSHKGVDHLVTMVQFSGKCLP